MTPAVRLTAAVTAALAVSLAAAPPAITMSLDDRSLQPGELIVVTMIVPGHPRGVVVSLFGRQTTAYEDSTGRWRALVGIDLDQKPGHYVGRASAGDARGSIPVVVKSKAFPTRRLSVDPDFVNPPDEALAQIARDSAFQRQIYEHPSPRRLWSGPFVRPVPGRANSRFGTRSVFNGQPRSPHAGADFMSGAGVPVRAPNAGRVVAARELYFPGNVVIIDHGLGAFSMLAHLSRIDVEEGDSVAAGDVVGLVGATGRVTGPHLHWSFSVNGARVDPLSVLALLGS